MIKEQSKHKEAPKVSFARDIKPLFRAVDYFTHEGARHKTGRLHLHVGSGQC